MKSIEPWLLLALLILHGFLYNEIGEMAAARGLDFAPLVETPIDSVIPFVPGFVIPYMLAWLYPILLIAYLMTAKVDSRSFRSLFITVLVLMVGCYLLWTLFPVRFGQRLDEGYVAGYGWFGRWVLFNYQNASHWNACPSFHVAGPWLLYRTARTLAPQLPKTFFWVFAAIGLSTVLIRIHYVMDIICGLLISELVFRLVFKPLHETKALDAVPKPAARALSLALLVAGFTGFALLVQN
jgi:hypothetical protein